MDVVGSRDDYHHHDSYHDTGCYEEGVSIALLLTTFLGILIMGYTLYTKIKGIGRRRRREEPQNNVMEELAHILVQLPAVVINGKRGKRGQCQ